MQVGVLVGREYHLQLGCAGEEFVVVGGKQGTVVRFQSDTEVIIQAPGGTPGAPVDVVVVFDPGGQLTLPGAFTFASTVASPRCS